MEARKCRKRSLYFVWLVLVAVIDLLIVGEFCLLVCFWRLG